MYVSRHVTYMDVLVYDYDILKKCNRKMAEVNEIYDVFITTSIVFKAGDLMFPNNNLKSPKNTVSAYGIHTARTKRKYLASGLSRPS